MKLIFYFLSGTYTQYVLGDPEITHIKPPKPLSMKDVLRYVTDTSKVLEELAKEHLWLLSRMTGTNNWKNLLSKEQEGVVEEAPQSEEGEGDERESPEPQKEETGDEKESPQPQEEETRDEKESSQPEEEGEDGESQSEGEVGNEEEQAVVEEGTPQPVEVQSMTEIEGSSPAEDEAMNNQNIDAGIMDTIKTKLQKNTKPTVDDKSHPLLSHSQHHHSHDKHHPQPHNPESNQKVGYSTDIVHGNSPDPTLNYLAWKDKPIQHHVDAYGKPVKESDKLHKGLGVTKASSVSPRIQSTQEKDVVFSPLPINKPEVTTSGKDKPIPNKMPVPTKDGDKITKQPNPLARLHNDHQVEPETITLPNGVFNPLAIDSFDALNDINVMNEIAGSNARSTVNSLQSDEPVKDPLDYPLQYYEPESVPSTHSTHRHHLHHPAHHSKLEDYDSGWW